MHGNQNDVLAIHAWFRPAQLLVLRARHNGQARTFTVSFYKTLFLYSDHTFLPEQEKSHLLRLQVLSNLPPTYQPATYLLKHYMPVQHSTCSSSRQRIMQ